MSKDNEQRLPPQSIESEIAVLGCLLIDPKAFPKACHYINKDSFYKKIHSIIFSAMQELDEAKESIDNVTLIEKLKQKKQYQNSKLQRLQEEVSYYKGVT